MLRWSLVWFLPWTQNFFQLSLCLLPSNRQMTVLSGRNSIQTTYNNHTSWWTVFTIDKETPGNYFVIWCLYVEPSQDGTVYTSESLLFMDVVWFTFPRMVTCIKSCLSVILSVKVVLTSTVTVVDWCFNNLSGRHLQLTLKWVSSCLLKKQPTTSLF